YETRFRVLLQQLGARRLEKGVHWLVSKAERLSASEGVAMPEALTRICSTLTAKPCFRRRNCSPAAVRFWCDAGLGGLARWLRAAGYEAAWQAGIADDE